jgi:plasmid rolling circle replication initiator protein Rep
MQISKQTSKFKAGMWTAREGKWELLQIFYKNGNVSLNAEILNFKMVQHTYRFKYFKQCSQNNKGLC